MRNFHPDEQGVSVIVGALLLILITVIAAAGLAMIVSQAEKQQADKQALQQAIDNEKLKIVSMYPTYSDTTGYMNGMDIVVQNLNVQESSIIAISLNGVYAKVCNLSKNISDDNNGRDYYFNGSRIKVPASGSVRIHLYDPADTSNFWSQVQLTQSNTMSVQLTTSYINYFGRTIKPPVAVMKFKVDTENIGMISRDYLTLDASGSYSDSGQIASYNWTIQDASGTYYYGVPTPGNWYDLVTGNITTDQINTSGNTLRYNPHSSGPLKINLTVRDDSGLIGRTDPVLIPIDQNFDPPFSVNASYDQNNTTIIATLKDAYNKGFPNMWVNFQPISPNVTISQAGGVTDTNGKVTANVSFIGGATSGTVLVSYQKLSCYVAVTLNSSIQSPTASFIADKLSGNAPLTVQFTDISTGSGITSREWNFGDGSANSTSQNPGHTFSNPGVYNVILTVTNNGGIATTHNQITVHNATPLAGFSANTVSGDYPLTVQFTDASTGNGITAWHWNFGDGATNDTQNPPVHTYNNPGKYTVTLTVTNDGGSSTEVKSDYITVVPIADFTYSSGGTNVINFLDKSIGNIVTWLWDFGDGTTGNTQNPSHLYISNGSHAVVLTVTDSSGKTSQKPVTIVVG